MSLRLYLTFMSISTLLCWVAWSFVLTFISPAEAGLTGLFFFYLSFFLAIVGTFSILGFVIRRKILKNDNLVFRHVSHTFRQSVIIAALIILALILLSKHLLTWWNGIILILLFIVLEGLVFSGRKFSNIDYVK